MSIQTAASAAAPVAQQSSPPSPPSAEALSSIARLRTDLEVAIADSRSQLSVLLRLSNDRDQLKTEVGALKESVTCACQDFDALQEKVRLVGLRSETVEEKVEDCVRSHAEFTSGTARRLGVLTATVEAERDALVDVTKFVDAERVTLAQASECIREELRAVREAYASLEGPLNKKAFPLGDHSSCKEAGVLGRELQEVRLVMDRQYNKLIELNDNLRIEFAQSLSVVRSDLESAQISLNEVSKDLGREFDECKRDMTQLSGTLRSIVDHFVKKRPAGTSEETEHSVSVHKVAMEAGREREVHVREAGNCNAALSKLAADEKKERTPRMGEARELWNGLRTLHAKRSSLDSVPLSAQIASQKAAQLSSMQLADLGLCDSVVVRDGLEVMSDSLCRLAAAVGEERARQ